MNILEYFSSHSQKSSETAPPYILAEAGVNHEGDLELGKRLVREAAEGGADGIKFQTYKAETIASRNSPAYWDLSEEPTTSQFELFKKYDKFGENEFRILAEECSKHRIDFLSTPFDLDSANYLAPLMDAFKVSSSDITNKPFLKHLASFGKPIVLSTGASRVEEIEEALGWISPSGVPVALLHCVLSYPTADEDANLGMIVDLRRLFPDYLIGYSDHTLPKDMRAIETAVLLGAGLIEKHFTHDKSLPGNDHYHAMDKEDLRTFRSNWSRLESLIGSSSKRDIPAELSARREARRSIVLARDLPAGHRLKTEDLTFKRPAHGISPKHWDDVIDEVLRIAVKEDYCLQWDMFEKKPKESSDS
jgi:N-acetylneuraminate synthase